MKTKIFYLAFGIMFGLISQASATNLILNGSFESGKYPGSSFITLYAVNNDIENWTVTTGSIDYIGGYWQASHGYRSIDLSGYHQAGEIEVSQPFQTTDGQQYLVTFDMAGNPDVQGVKDLRVTVAGQFYDFQFNSTGKTKTNMGWVTKSFIFTAKGDNSMLKFTSLTTSAWGPALDNVSVMVIPEPGTFLLLGLVIVGYLGYSWQRCKRTI